MNKQSKAVNALYAIYPHARPAAGEGYNMIRAERYDNPVNFENLVMPLFEAFPSSLFDHADYVEVRFSADTITVYTGHFLSESEVYNVRFLYEASYQTDTDS